MNSEKYLMKLLETIQNRWETTSSQIWDGLIVILPEVISIRETPYSVGQLKAMLTAKGFENLIRGEWTKEELCTGSNYIVSKIEYAGMTGLHLRLLHRKRWGYERGNQNSSIILPYKIDSNYKVLTFLKSIKPATAYQVDITESEDGVVSVTESEYCMDIFL